MSSLLFRDYLARLNEDWAYMVGLVTVTAPGLAEPLRLNSTTDREVVSRGDTYFRSGFDYRIPSRLGEGEQRTTLVLPVVDRTILDRLDALPERLAVTLEIVLSRTPDVVELGPFHLVDLGRSFDAGTQTLAVECSYRDVLSHPRPRLRFVPGAFPGLFGKAGLS